MRLEVSDGGILVIGGVIIAAAALAAHRGYVNKQKNKRKTTPGSCYEQYHKEKEEEVKDSSSINNGYGEITAADGLVEIKVGSMTEIDEQASACSYDDDDDGGSELCLCQSHTEERAETVVGHVEVGEEKVSACYVDEEIKKEKEDDDDACAGHGQEDQLSDEMLFVHACNQMVIHVEDDTKQADEDKQEEKESCGEETEPVVEELGKEEEEEGEPSFHNVVPKDEVEEGECDCREEGCNPIIKEEEPATESYQEETEPLAEEELERGEVQSNETIVDEEPVAEFVANIIEEEGERNRRGEEYDYKEVGKQGTESDEEQTEILVKEEELHAEPAVNTEEVQEDEPCDAKEEPSTTESCEEETGSSDDDSGASSTENVDAVQHDETKEQTKKINETMLNRLMMMMMTVEKKKDKALFIYMNHHSRSMFFVVLAIALALVLLSFHLSHLTVL